MSTRRSPALHSCPESSAEIAAITEPQTRVIFFADAVFIEGDGLDEPWGE